MGPTLGASSSESEQQSTRTLSRARSRATSRIAGNFGPGESWKPQATKLAKAGHTALAIDENPDKRWASVLAAVNYLRQKQNVQRIVLVGASTGEEAVVVANAGADAGRIDGTVTLSAAGGANYASQLQGRLLFVVSKNDERRFVQTAKALHRKASEPKALVTYTGDTHGQRFFTSSYSDALRNCLQAFISEACS